MSGVKFFLMLFTVISALFSPYANSNSSRVMIGVSCRVIRTGNITFCPIVYSKNMPLDLMNALENINIKCPEGTTLSLSYHIESISSFNNQPFCPISETKLNDSMLNFYKNADCSEELQPGAQLKIDFNKKDKKGIQPIYCTFDPERSYNDVKSPVEENENVVLIIELNY